MQPKTVVLFVIIFPLLAMNIAYLLSAQAGLVPWCVPYFDGCTSISRAGRSGYSIFVYRILVVVYSFSLMLFWLYASNWLDLLHGKKTRMSRVILYLGLISSTALLLYINFLGTSGELNTFLRRTGSYIYFALSPIAQLLLLIQHYALQRRSPDASLNLKILQYQRIVVILMALFGAVSVYFIITNQNTAEREYIVEWNVALLLVLYYAGMISLWKNFSQVFTIKQN